MLTPFYFFFLTPTSTPVPPATLPGTPLALRRYPATRASQLKNDSATVSGTTTADALDALQAEIGGGMGGGLVNVDLPTVKDAVAVWDDTAGELVGNCPVEYVSAANWKHLFNASAGIFITVTDAATVTFDLNQANAFVTTMGADGRVFAVANVTTGQFLTIIYQQDGTGDRTPVWFANIDWHEGLPPIIDPTANGWNIVTLFCTGVAAYVPTWREVSRTTSAPRKGIKTLIYASTVTLDTRVSRDLGVVLGGSPTLVVQGKGLYVGLKFTFEAIQDGTGTRTVTWWGSISWAGGSAPTLSSAAGKKDRFVFIVTSVGGSPTYEGFIAGQGI